MCFSLDVEWDGIKAHQPVLATLHSKISTNGRAEEVCLLSSPANTVDSSSEARACVVLPDTLAQQSLMHTAPLSRTRAM